MACLVTAATGAQADVVVISDLPLGGGSGGGNPQLLWGSRDAAAFGFRMNAGQNVKLSDVILRLGFMGGGHDITVTLNRDNAGRPGSVLEVLSNPTLPAFSLAYSDYKFTSNANTNLSSLTTYWVVMENTSGFVAWGGQQNQGANPGGLATMVDSLIYNGGWASLGAIDLGVTVHATPELSTFALGSVLVAVATWIEWRRARRARAA